MKGCDAMTHREWVKLLKNTFFLGPLRIFFNGYLKVESWCLWMRWNEKTRQFSSFLHESKRKNNQKNTSGYFWILITSPSSLRLARKPSRFTFTHSPSKTNNKVIFFQLLRSFIVFKTQFSCKSNEKIIFSRVWILTLKCFYWMGGCLSDRASV